MNHNCTCQTSVNRQPQFFIPRSAIAIDERIAFIDSVCATLIESRFGPGRVSQLIVKWSDRPEFERAVFYELSDGEVVPCYGQSPHGRTGYQVIEAAYRRAKQMGLAAARPSGTNSTPLSAPNQPRGSPPTSGTRGKRKTGDVVQGFPGR